MSRPRRPGRQGGGREDDRRTGVARFLSRQSMRRHSLSLVGERREPNATNAAATVGIARAGRAPRRVEAPLEETCSQAEPGSASCVQRFDDSLNSAIRTTYRISLRSSSLREPRYPSTRVVCFKTTKLRGDDDDDTPRGAPTHGAPEMRGIRRRARIRAGGTTEVGGRDAERARG